MTAFTVRDTRPRRNWVISAVLFLVLAAGCGGDGAGEEESSTGELIAYWFVDAPKSIWALYLMNSDGTDPRPLLEPGQLDFYGEDPAWSPDGQRLAFSGSDPESEFSDIWVANVDGSDLRNLTHTEDGWPQEIDPTWSPDGEEIAFSSNRCPSDSCIFVMDDDGSDVRRLTRGPVDWQPAWSPDGNRIAFWRGNDIYIAQTDGSGEQRLTESSCSERYTSPAWSPDGRRIAYTHSIYTVDGKRSCGGDGVFGNGLGLMRADGTKRQRLLEKGTNPSWSPRGDRIAFEGPCGVHVVDLASRETRRLTACQADVDSSTPAWQSRQ